MEAKTDCPICTLSYDLEKQRPWVLSCGHTLCRECLNKILSQQTEDNICPFDRKSFSSHAENFALLDIIEKRFLSGTQIKNPDLSEIKQSPVSQSATTKIKSISDLFDPRKHFVCPAKHPLQLRKIDVGKYNSERADDKVTKKCHICLKQTYFSVKPSIFVSLYFLNYSCSCDFIVCLSCSKQNLDEKGKYNSEVCYCKQPLSQLELEQQEAFRPCLLCTELSANFLRCISCIGVNICLKCLPECQECRWLWKSQVEKPCSSCKKTTYGMYQCSACKKCLCVQCANSAPSDLKGINNVNENDRLLLEQSKQLGIQEEGKKEVMKDVAESSKAKPACCNLFMVIGQKYDNPLLNYPQVFMEISRRLGMENTLQASDSLNKEGHSSLLDKVLQEISQEKDDRNFQKRLELLQDLLLDVTGNKKKQTYIIY